MATLKRQKADGTWEYTSTIGTDINSRVTAIENEINKLEATATITTTWEGATAPYTQAVTVTLA